MKQRQPSYICLVYVDKNKREEFDVGRLLGLAQALFLRIGKRIGRSSDEGIYDEGINYRQGIYAEYDEGSEPNESVVIFREGPILNRFSYETENKNSGASFLKEAIDLEHVVSVSLRKKIN